MLSASKPFGLAKQWRPLGAMCGVRSCSWIAAIVVLLMAGAGCSREHTVDDVLVRVGAMSLTLPEYEQAVRMAAEEALLGNEDDALLRDIRLRVANQLSEELMLAAYAADHGIVLSGQELEAAVDAIKGEYPDDTFEETLLENAVSYHYWRRRLASRLLAEKVIARELVDQVQITSEDVIAYLHIHYPGGIPEEDDSGATQRRIVEHLRRQKAETAYKEWIAFLSQSYPVEINRQLWDRWTSGGH